jgi:hypothetical protein
MDLNIFQNHIKEILIVMLKGQTTMRKNLSAPQHSPSQTTNGHHRTRKLVQQASQGQKSSNQFV